MAQLTAKLTNQEYADNAGHCPVCESDEIEGCEGVRIEDNLALQDVYCLDCESTWTDVYRLVGYGNLVGGETK